MRIAVTYEDGNIFQHFGHTETFKVYEVEDGKVLSSRLLESNGSGHGALAGFLKMGGVDRGANTTPGNKKGGLSNIIEKSMGSIAKSGTSPIVEVLSPGERPTKHGEIFAATPASDLFCGTSQLASGMGLQVFMTGRGTPYGLAAAPVIKVCSSSEMKEQWPDIIDYDAGPAALGKATIAEQGEEMFRYILDVASGRRQPYSEQYRWHNDICIFNPAPIT